MGEMQQEMCTPELCFKTGGGSGGCLENNASATSEWETWEVQF